MMHDATITTHRPDTPGTHLYTHGTSEREGEHGRGKHSPTDKIGQPGCIFGAPRLMNFRATSANGRDGGGYPNSSHAPFTPLSARVVLCRRAARQGRKYVWEYMVASVTASNHRKTKTATNQPRRLHLRGREPREERREEESGRAEQNKKKGEGSWPSCSGSHGAGTVAGSVGENSCLTWSPC